MVVVASVMFGVPMPNSSSDLTDEVEPALLSQVPKIADQVCDGMLVTSAAVPLKYRDGLGGPRDVVGFIRHGSGRDISPANNDIERFAKAYPRVVVRVVEETSGQLRDLIASGVLDVAITNAHEPSHGVVSQPLGRERMLLV